MGLHLVKSEAVDANALHHKKKLLTPTTRWKVKRGEVVGTSKKMCAK